MKYEEDLMRERIQKLMHREGISQGDFARKIGRQSANMSQILSGERHIPRTFGMEVTKAFPNVNRDWLLFGEGDMYLNEESAASQLTETRPRLPLSGSGGHIEDYYNGDKRSLCQERPIIKQFSDYDFTLVVKNSRMSPRYERGDIIAFKKSTIIEWGNDYLIDTSEGPKIKAIFDEGNSVRCSSYDRERYPDFWVPKNLIYGYYRIVGVIRVL